MAKKSKFTLIEPNEDDLALFSTEWTSLGQINTAIEKLESTIPDKRTKEYSEWLTKINFLIDVYNKNAHFKAFKKYE